VATLTASGVDLDRLLGLDLGRTGELGQPIDATEAGPLGPLWPGGAPDWFTKDRVEPVATREPSSLTELDPAGPLKTASQPYPACLWICIQIYEFHDIDVASKAIADLGYALNAYLIAAGGNGAALDDWEILVPHPESVASARMAMGDRHDLIFSQATGLTPPPPGLLSELGGLIRQPRPRVPEPGLHWSKGLRNQEVAKATEIRAAALTKLGPLENERLRLVQEREAMVSKVGAGQEHDQLVKLSEMRTKCQRTVIDALTHLKVKGVRWSGAWEFELVGDLVFARLLRLPRRPVH
jgi:hypothetical protein